MKGTANKNPAGDFRKQRAVIYARVVKNVRKQTTKQVFASLIGAGIYTKQGHLSKVYQVS